MDLLTSAIIFLIVLAILYALARYIGQQLKVPDPYFVVLNVLFALVVVLWLLHFFMPIGPWYYPRRP